MSPAPVVINGWTIFAHPLFLNQGDALAAIAKLALEVIPQDPSRPEYRQGSTLGDEYKHWFRAKFFQQYRLFFRYHQVSKIIVYAWLNDTDTKRAYDSAADAYRVFRGMLEAGHPADGWDALLVEARAMRMRLANATGMLVQE